MGSVHPYYVKTSKKPRFLVSYRDPSNRQVLKRGFTRKYDAERYLRTVEVSKDRGEYVDPGDAKVTIETLGNDWLKDRKTVMKPSSYRAVDSAWRIHVLGKWGQREVGSIRHSEVQTWVSALAKTKSATTVLRAHGTLASILDIAVKDRRVMTNAARGVLLPRKKAKGKTYLSREQVAKLAAASRYPLLVLFLAFTGLRWGEATGLRVKHVDLMKRRVRVEENAVMVGGYIQVGTPKTHEVRSVPFPAFLASAIEDAMSGKSQTDLLFGDGAVHMRLPNSANGWFMSAIGRVQAEYKDFPRVTPHDLRHTAASLAVSAGANVKAVQRMLGHASAAMTLDVYSDLFDDDLDGVAEALDHAAKDSSVITVLSRSDSDNEKSP
jgi:integrase